MSSSINKKWVLAFCMALLLFIPSILKSTWTSGFGAPVFFLNLPSIFFMAAGRYLPPEGYPGQNIVGAVIIILGGQTICWYYFITCLVYLRRKIFGPRDRG